MATVTNALDYLADTKHGDVRPVVALFGDEPFLKRLVRAELRRTVLGDDEGEFSLTTCDGEKAEWRDVIDELSTVALFGGGRRLVVVEDADDFVTRYRSQLEDYVAKPKSGGVLVLEVGSFPSNTRLYKAVAASGLPIDCNAPAEARLLKWLVSWAKERHQAKLERSAAEEMLEIVGPQLGLLDQELAKLASSAGIDGTITPSMVEDLVGGWRAKTTWDMLDAAVAGHAGDALVQLDRLLLGGDAPIAIMGQIGSTLRRFAAATRLIQQAEDEGQRPALRAALEGAGFKSFIIGKAEGQLKQIGRQRGEKLYRWLLDADLALKGSSSAAGRARIVLEQLIARLSTAADPRNAKAKPAPVRR